jgi:hypothetical protein
MSPPEKPRSGSPIMAKEAKTMPTEIILNSDRSGLPAEPLMTDTTLAERLGYENARDIRKLIKRNLPALGAMGLVRHHSAPIVSGKGRVQHVTAYSLNRAQAAPRRAPSGPRVSQSSLPRCSRNSPMARWLPPAPRPKPE